MIAVPALVGLILLVARAETGRVAAWVGLFGGAGYFALALNWIIEPFLVDAARYGWMAPFAVVLLAFGLALFWAAAAAISYRAPQRALGFAVALAAVELARGYVLTGFPWALIGHIWVDTPLAQVGALIGPSGLTLMTTLAAGLAAGLTWTRGAAGAGLLVAGLGWGLWTLAAPEPGPRGVTVRLVQPNAIQSLKWDTDKASFYLQRQLEFTAALPRPSVVIWPETSVPYLLDRNPEVAEAIADAAAGVPAIVGIQRVEGEQYWNTLAVIGAGGAVTARYDKHHLVPFGEYMPAGDLAYRLFGIRAFAARQGNGYSPGPGPQVMHLGPSLGTILPLICYEAVFPQDLRAETRADWILQITNDAWFGTLTGPYQHLAQARLRAIEQGLPLVRVANTGISAVIDARGRVVAEIPLGQAAYLDVALPGALPPTLYARAGEVPVLMLLAGLCLWLFRRRPLDAPAPQR